MLNNYKRHNIFDDSKLIINVTIHKFLFILIRVIFLKERKNSKDKVIIKKLKVFISYINDNMIKKDEKKINERYDINNLNNILDFIKNQNRIFAYEIIQNILIVIFSYAFKTEKENTFGKYIYNDIGNLKEPESYRILLNWIDLDKFNKEINEKDAIKVILQKDFKESEKSEIQKKIYLHQFLEKIDNEKYNEKNIPKKNLINYMNGSIIYKENLNFKKPEKKEDTQYSISIPLSISTLMSNFLYGNKIGHISKFKIGLFRSLIISVYIYYQNKNSSLMKYIKSTTDNKKDIENIPFVYNLSEAAIESIFSNIIFAPARIEPRIEELNMSKNSLKDIGLSELSKVILFNKNIKKIVFHACIKII